MSQIKDFTLIIGAMKCGTTSLYYYLVQHPQVCQPLLKKEPMFFSRKQWTQGLQSYQQIWTNYNHKIHKTCLEASTEYTRFPAFPNVAERIYQFSQQYNIRFKFIYIMRDPIDAIVSGLHHGYHRGWCSSNKKELTELLLQVFKYSKQIEIYSEKFPQEDLLLVQFEELLENPTQLMHKIFDFLDLDTSFKIKKHKIVYNSSEERKRKKQREELYQALLKRNTAIEYISHLFPQKAQNVAAEIIYQSTLRYFPHLIKQEQELWTLNEDEKKIIISKLQESLSELETKYKIDVSKWKTSRSLSS
jgi:hypothetical protein